LPPAPEEFLPLPDPTAVRPKAVRGDEGSGIPPRMLERASRAANTSIRPAVGKYTGRKCSTSKDGSLRKASLKYPRLESRVVDPTPASTFPPRTMVGYPGS
jgi:hypothetical protein